MQCIHVPLTLPSYCTKTPVPIPLTTYIQLLTSIYLSRIVKSVYATHIRSNSCISYTCLNPLNSRYVRWLSHPRTSTGVYPKLDNLLSKQQNTCMQAIILQIHRHVQPYTPTYNPKCTQCTQT